MYLVINSWPIMAMALMLMFVVHLVELDLSNIRICTDFNVLDTSC